MTAPHDPIVTLARRLPALWKECDLGPKSDTAFAQITWIEEHITGTQAVSLASALAQIILAASYLDVVRCAVEPEMGLDDDVKKAIRLLYSARAVIERETRVHGDNFGARWYMPECCNPFRKANRVAEIEVEGGARI